MIAAAPMAAAGCEGPRRLLAAFFIALVPSAAIAEGPAQMLLERVNRARTQVVLPALELHPAVLEVAQAMASEVTAAGGSGSVDLSAQAVMAALEARGYAPRLAVLGMAQAAGDFATVLDRWQTEDLPTFELLLEAELRHLGLGIGDARGVPVYVLVAAVSADAHGREAATRLGDLDEVRAGVLERTNRERKQRRLPPLRRSRELDRVAQDFAQAMLTRDFYGHRSPEGDDVMDRVRLAGLDFERVGENLASGQPSVDLVMDGWLASPDHRDNILHRQFRLLGVGLAYGNTPDGGWGFRWVQGFAQP